MDPIEFINIKKGVIMHGIETIKAMNRIASDKEQREFSQDLLENQAILEAIKEDVVKQLTKELKLNGSLPGHRVA